MRKTVLFLSFLAAGVVVNLSLNLPVVLAAGVSSPWEAAVALLNKTFAPFAPSVATHAEDQSFVIESNGMPNHPLMVGITAWQQQVPLPQKYTGSNAWRVPLFPVESKQPLSAKTHFFRGAIAIAADGVPIFNPIKNDGVTDTFLAGELDQYGGHSGKADDYHYHVAPVFLASQLPSDAPIAWALDGYPIYGYTEPDGSAVTGLDAFNGHKDAQGHYHYHATKTYPYLNGGFHGQVVEREGQVDPQPMAQPVRPDTKPLDGAKITGFVTNAPQDYTLTYTVGAAVGTVRYTVMADKVRFVYKDVKGKETTQDYPLASGSKPAPGPGEPPPRGGEHP